MSLKTAVIVSYTGSLLYPIILSSNQQLTHLTSKLGQDIRKRDAACTKVIGTLKLDRTCPINGRLLLVNLIYV